MGELLLYVRCMGELVPVEVPAGGTVADVVAMLPGDTPKRLVYQGSALPTTAELCATGLSNECTVDAVSGGWKHGEAMRLCRSNSSKVVVAAGGGFGCCAFWQDPVQFRDGVLRFAVKLTTAGSFDARYEVGYVDPEGLDLDRSVGPQKRCVV
eukprot:TRINITY_DN15879_c0_g1_i1.p2 TRINITY_DN15879_c0_g1~~TRINITY_DN15879_c0_g1_i1.p2  ORF type:complete len:153 (+),score=50.49 TRINITY_DN15879_c0_g1_i1:70-528(+)